MKMGLGPAKGKDFASSLGPVILTSEALADRTTDRPGVYDLEMMEKVYGVEVFIGNFRIYSGLSMRLLQEHQIHENRDF
jgi:hypothetical protein